MRPLSTDGAILYGYNGVAHIYIEKQTKTFAWKQNDVFLCKALNF